MQRQPPRFVPTLTEVIDLELDVALAPAAEVAAEPIAPAPVLADSFSPHAAVESSASVAPLPVAEDMLPPVLDESVPVPAALPAEPAPVEASAPAAAVDMEALVQAAVMAQLPAVMAQLQPVVEDAIRTAVLRSLGHLGAQR